MKLVFSRDWKVFERDAKRAGDSRCIRVVTNDQGNFRFELACLMPEQKILQTMRQLRYENRNSWNLIAKDQYELHATLESDSLKALANTFPRNLKSVQLPLGSG
jgi:hypothetical protein